MPVAGSAKITSLEWRKLLKLIFSHVHNFFYFGYTLAIVDKRQLNIYLDNDNRSTLFYLN